MKRCFIVHGWGGFPEEGWFPWLKKALESKGWKVIVPAMPHPERPDFSWIDFLAEKVGKLDNDTYFITHSVGTQAVLLR